MHQLGLTAILHCTSNKHVLDVSFAKYFNSVCDKSHAVHLYAGWNIEVWQLDLTLVSCEPMLQLHDANGFTQLLIVVHPFSIRQIHILKHLARSAFNPEAILQSSSVLSVCIRAEVNQGPTHTS